MLVAAESWWLARRTLRRGAYDEPSTVTVDTLTGCAGLAACALAARADEQFGSVNWMFPLTLLSAVGTSGGYERRRQSTAAVGALALTYAVASGSQASTSRRAALFGVSQYAGCLVAGDIIVRRLRRNAAAIATARREAVERAARVAEERERSRLQQELHTGALHALEELRELWPVDPGAARLVARREAIRLRRALRGGRDGNGRTGLAQRVDDVVRTLAAEGLRAEIVIDEIEQEPADDAAVALASALETALRNVIAHAGTTSAVVRVAELDDAIEVTVRDRGRGTDRPVPPPRVVKFVKAAGGDVRWWSGPGAGTRVTMRVPR